MGLDILLGVRPAHFFHLLLNTIIFLNKIRLVFLKMRKLYSLGGGMEEIIKKVEKDFPKAKIHLDEKLYFYRFFIPKSKKVPKDTLSGLGQTV